MELGATTFPLQFWVIWGHHAKLFNLFEKTVLNLHSCMFWFGRQIPNGGTGSNLRTQQKGHLKKAVRKITFLRLCLSFNCNHQSSAHKLSQDYQGWIFEASAWDLQGLHKELTLILLNFFPLNFSIRIPPRGCPKHSSSLKTEH